MLLKRKKKCAGDILRMSDLKCLLTQLSLRFGCMLRQTAQGFSLSLAENLPGTIMLCSVDISLII